MQKQAAQTVCELLTAGTTGLLLMLGSVSGCAEVALPDIAPNGFEAPAPAPAPVPVPIPMAVRSEPPTVSGGTLLITKDDQLAVAADPDRDAVWIVSLSNKKVSGRVRLDAGAEPGRLVEDKDGMVHVALRRGGSVVKIDPTSSSIVSTRAVCAAPRGIAYDAATDNLHVACESGELVTLKARGGDVARRLFIDRDLRDVIVRGDHLLVSRFRSAELLDLDAMGALVARLKPRQIKDQGKPPTNASPTTAWRLIAMPENQVLMLHQRATDDVIVTRPGYYSGGNCMLGGIVTPAITMYGIDANGQTLVSAGSTPVRSSLAVDVAVSPDGKQITLINFTDSLTGPAATATYSSSTLEATDPCQEPTDIGFASAQSASSQFIAAAYDSAGRLHVQSREPARLVTFPGNEVIPFPDAEDRTSKGHQLFHQPTKSMLACASCHPEAGDDSHVFNFEGIGPRRTQSLRGGILATAPFHWDGDMNDLTTLMTQVFTGRMSGPPLAASQVSALGSWLDAQPALPHRTPDDPAAVSRGRTLFNDAAVGCVSCHSGAHLTNNQNSNVGTGGTLQVPSLIDLATRAPYLHSGCAPTLRERFTGACGGGDSHGKTSALSTAQLDDLIAYLETL